MDPQVVNADSIVEVLREQASAEFRAEMGPRYGIHTPQAFGVPMRELKALATQIGTSHDVASDLWATGWYEARTIASLIDDPLLVTGEQMDAWCADFDNWAICDSVCFNLFDRTTQAWDKVHQWSTAAAEFEKRAAFALLWSLALHAKNAPDAAYLDALALIEREATDPRPLVSKSLSMALRATARRGPVLSAAVSEAADRMASSTDRHASAIGRRCLRELAKTS